MLTAPKLASHPHHKRQNTLDNLLVSNLSSLNSFQLNKPRSDRNIQIQHQPINFIKNKQNFLQKTKPQLTNRTNTNICKPGSKLNVQKYLNITTIEILPQKNKSQQNKQLEVPTYQRKTKNIQCFSPKYIKQRQENQKILQSLKLENEKHKRLIQQNDFLRRKQNINFIEQCKFLTQSQKTNNFVPNMKKTPQKQILYNPRIALEEMTNLTTSFIIDDSNYTINEFPEKLSKQCKNDLMNEHKKNSQGFSQKFHVSDFQKIKFLGKGNFGQVNLVRHKKSNFICAMKVIKKSFVKEENVVHQISRQIRIHLSLKHLNIIGFYGFFDDSQNIYLLIQYATGGQLYKKLKQCYRMPEVEVVPIIRNAIDGLRSIHSLGYIHRDLKPQNMIFQFGIGKICDLGWAADCGFNETRKSFCGTPLYLAPEMIKKQNYDRSADIWSIGILTYELLVGKIPFNIWSQYDLQQIVDRQIKFPTSYVDMSAQSIDFMKKCLIKNPLERIKLEQLINHPFLNKKQGEGYFNVQIYNGVESLFQ